jgi:hypothetical protein
MVRATVTMRHAPPSLRACASLMAALALLALPAEARPPKKIDPPALPREHNHPSGALTFRTPEGWTVVTPETAPETVIASGDGVMARFVVRQGESGYDSLHGACMMERLAGPMETAPAVKYEYDYVGGIVGDRRALDSAFVVHYDEPIQGHRDWRQRNITVVGGGYSICVVLYAPAAVWKKSAESRVLLDAVLGSVQFH